MTVGPINDVGTSRPWRESKVRLGTEMAYTLKATSNAMTFNEVITRLSAREAVDGLLSIGSTSSGELTAASDYDLVIVLSAMPASLGSVGVTYIDGRFTDLLFVTTEQLDDILGLQEPIDHDDWLGRSALFDGSRPRLPGAVPAFYRRGRPRAPL